MASITLYGRGYLPLDFLVNDLGVYRVPPSRFFLRGGTPLDGEQQQITSTTSTLP